MTYKIYKSDGTLLTEVADNSTDTVSTSLALVGKGSKIYGEAFASNFIHLLEHFSSAVAPAAPLVGQIWYDKAVKDIKVFDGTEWNATGEGYFETIVKPTVDGLLAQINGFSSQFTNNDIDINSLLTAVYGVVGSDFDYDSVVNLYDRVVQIGVIINDIDNLKASSESSARALQLSWKYDDTRFSYEMWGNTAFTWLDIQPTSVREAIVGDDTLDVISTTGLAVNNKYVIINADGRWVEDVEILSVLSNSRLRLKSNIQTTMSLGQGYKLARTSVDSTRFGSTVFKDKDTYFSRTLDTIELATDGVITINRNGEGSGRFAVKYRVVGTDTWNTANFLRSEARANDGTRDEDYYIPTKGKIDVEIKYIGNTTADTDTVRYFALYPAPKITGIDQILRPKNVSPAALAINVGQTPVLQGSDYLHLYDKVQKGAQFRIALDAAMSNIVLNSSTDNLAAWVSVAGNSNVFRDVCVVSNGNFLAVADGGAVLKTTNSGVSFSAQTSSVTTDLKGVDVFGTKAIAVGTNGTIIYNSTSGTGVWTTATAADSFLGTFNSVAVIADYALIVGASGTIQRSSNGGVIWNTITPPVSYTGTYYDVVLVNNGRGIAVGSGGAIHTTSDAGSTWVARNNSGNFTGNWRSVTMNETGYAIAVGDAGQVQISSDFGATWTLKTLPEGVSTNNLVSVACYLTNFVIVGASGTIISSNDSGTTFFVRIPGGGSSPSFTGVAIDNSNSGIIVGLAGATQRTINISSTATTSYTVPEGFLSTNKVYFWDVQYSDGVYSSERSFPTAFATSTTFEYTEQPQNISPANNASASITPILVSSEYRYYGAPDTHLASQWQISTTQSFSTILHDSGQTSTAKVSYQVPDNSGVTNLGTYFWRVRHRGTRTNFGAWSVPTSFSVQSMPNTPTVIEPVSNGLDVSIVPTIKTTPFSSSTSIAHIRSQYQLSLVNSFSSRVYDSGETTDLIEHKIATPLAYNTVYWVRARHKDANGSWSSYSTPQTFKTSGEIFIQDIFASTPYTGNSTSLRRVTTGVTVDASKDGAMIITNNLSAAYGPVVHSTLNSQQNYIQTSTSSGLIFDPNLFQRFDEKSHVLQTSYLTNGNGSSYMSYIWKETRGFMDATANTGDGSARRSVPHNLKTKPGMVIVKGFRMPGGQGYSTDWYVYHSALGAGNVLFLNRTNGATSMGNAANSPIQEPTDSDIILGSMFNYNGYEQHIFSFADNNLTDNDPSFKSLIKTGIYTAAFNSGSSTYATINLGWQPQWVLIKRVDTNGDWCVVDSKRGTSTVMYLNGGNNISGSPYLRFNSSGFDVVTGNSNFGANGGRYIYMAIRAQ